MRSVPAGSFERLSSFPGLWRAWQAYRRGKRRRPAVADFDIDADLELLALRENLGSCLAITHFSQRPCQFTFLPDFETVILSSRPCCCSSASW
jgi:hypothetical protein